MPRLVEVMEKDGKVWVCIGKPRSDFEGQVELYTPEEIRRLLADARMDERRQVLQEQTERLETLHALPR